MTPAEYCPSCEKAQPTYTEKGLVCCKYCNRIIRAELSKDPAQQSLLD